MFWMRGRSGVGRRAVGVGCWAPCVDRDMGAVRWTLAVEGVREMRW